MKNHIWILYIMFLSACASYDKSARQESVDIAACRSQEFLSKNGYLDRRTEFEPEQITLSMWDWMQYGDGENIDYNALLNDRAGRFDNRLHAVKIIKDYFLVYYKIGNIFSCVQIENGNAHLSDANCILRGDFHLMSQTYLDCESNP
jgi:hypothetical protein